MGEKDRRQIEEKQTVSAEAEAKRKLQADKDLQDKVQVLNRRLGCLGLIALLGLLAWLVHAPDDNHGFSAASPQALAG